jgi:hypothetical protein
MLTGRSAELLAALRRTFPRWNGTLGLTLQHTNRDVLVEGPEIMIRPVGTRRLVAGGSR